MKKLFFTIVVLLATSFAVNADPAKKVNLSYQDGKLKIEVIHKVNNISKHFINQIIIKADGKVIKEIDPKEQSSKQAEIVEVSLPDLKTGTKIEVVTRCSQFGKKAGKLTL